MNIPPFLKAGDTIGIAATARKVTPGELQPAIALFHKWGLNVKLSETIFNEYYRFAGTDEERTHGLQHLLDDDSVNAIIIARGGYGTLPIIDMLDFTRFAEFPKWIVGYSDVTVLHAHISKVWETATIHAIMPSRLKEEHGNTLFVNSLKDALFGNRLSHEFEVNILNTGEKLTGEMVGGNLSVLQSLAGSISQPDMAGKILFIEDIDEYLYHIDRMMQSLKRCGMLSGLAGILVGDVNFSTEEDDIPFGFSVGEIILNAVKEFNYPVIFDFPAGHIEHNMAMRFGMECKVWKEDNRMIFEQ